MKITSPKAKLHTRMNFTFNYDFLFLSISFSSFLFVILHPVAQTVKHDACNLKVMGLIPCFYMINRVLKNISFKS